MEDKNYMFVIEERHREVSGWSNWDPVEGHYTKKAAEMQAEAYNKAPGTEFRVIKYLPQKKTE